MKIIIKNFFTFYYILILANFYLFSADNSLESTLIYKKNKAILYEMNTGQMNKIDFLNMSYYLKKNEGDTIKKIYKFYVNKLQKLGYQRNKYSEKREGNEQIIECSFLNDKNMFSLIIVGNNNANTINVSISIMNNDILFNKKAFNLKTKKDNPGFDFRDIPRYPGSIRILSICAKDITHNISRQVMYKFYNDKDSVLEFYKRRLPEKGWIIKDLFDYKGYKTLSCIKGERKVDILIHYNPEIRKNVILIVED